MVKISALPSATEFAGDDLIAIVQDNETRKIRAADFLEKALSETLDQVAAEQSNRWRIVPDSDWDATPLTTSRISTDSPMLTVGTPIRVVQGGVTRYVIVSAKAASHVDVLGPALNIAQTITLLEASTPDRVVQVDMFIAGFYGSSTGDKLVSVMRTRNRWMMGPARIAHFAAVQHAADSTVQPRVNLKVNANLVSTANSNQGIDLSTAGTWVDNPVATINSANASMVFGDSMEINVAIAAGTGNASDLTLSVLLIME